jgi:hypothetical protein
MTVWNDDLVFIHVPKTGGKWVMEAMKRAGIEFGYTPGRSSPHPTLDEIDTRGRFAFAFVREPFAWYRSIWAHHQTRDLSEWKPFDQWLDLPLPGFIEAIAENVPDYMSKRFDRYIEGIDFVGRTENLVQDLVCALNLANVDFDERNLRATPRQNVSAPAPDCPSAIRAKLEVSERDFYERFYPDKVPGART